METFRAYGQLRDIRNRIFRTIYDLEVYKVNNKFTAQGMTLLTEIISLVIVAGVSFFALSRTTKRRSTEELALVGTSITLALKLTSIMTKIVRDCAEVEVGMKTSIVT